MTTDIEIVLPTALGKKRVEELENYADALESLSRRIGMKVSARGWAYVLEGEGLITKDQFDKVAAVNGECVDKGFIPVDFFAEDVERQFSGVEEPSDETVAQDLAGWLRAALDAENMHAPDWWEGETYYIQMVVEKKDIKTLFEDVCARYHVPIANARGWSSKYQRAIFARRFKEAEERGLTAVLLYLGDHDPDGIRISDFLRENLRQLQNIVWEDGTEGYDPENLIIDRFGLDYDTIQRHNLVWIDNLITASGKDLGTPAHKNFRLPYVQEYLKTVGRRKCEANALLKIRPVAKKLCRFAIEKYLGVHPKLYLSKRSLPCIQSYVFVHLNVLCDQRSY